MRAYFDSDGPNNPNLIALIFQNVSGVDRGCVGGGVIMRSLAISRKEHLSCEIDDMRKAPMVNNENRKSTGKR